MLLTFVRMVTLSTGILQTMILSRTLSKEVYGTYSEGLLVISFLAPFFSLGLTESVNYFFNKSDDEKQRESYINTIFSLSLFAGLIGGVVILACRSLIGLFFDNTAIISLMIYIAFRPCLQNIISLYQPLYISNNYAKIIALRNLVVSVLQVVIVGAVSCFSSNLMLLFGLLLVLDIIQVLLFGLFYEKNCCRLSVVKMDRKLIRPILAFALPMLLATSISTIHLSVDKLMISNLMTVEDYALYANMAKELPFSFLISAFTIVITPFVVKCINQNKIDEFKKLWADYLEIGYTLTWPLCIGAFVVAPELISFLYSDTYLTKNGVVVFRIYAVVAMFRFTFFGLIPSALGKTNVVLKYSIIGMITNLVFNIVFFEIWGIMGPPLATVLSLIVSSFLYFRTSLKLIGLRMMDIFRAKRVFSLVFVMVLSSAIIILLERYVFGNIKKNVIKLVVEYGLFVLICYGTRIRRLKYIAHELNGIRGSSNE